MAAFACGIGLGMSFAVTPANGALLRPVHAELNLFGWAAMLITGVTYYLAPRFAGTPLRWPRLVPIQLALTAGGLVAGVALVWLRLDGHDAGAFVGLAHLASAVGLGMLGVIVAATFAPAPRMSVVSLQLQRRPPVH